MDSFLFLYSFQASSEKTGGSFISDIFFASTIATFNSFVLSFEGNIPIKVAFPKTEVLEKPHLTDILANLKNIVKLTKKQ